MKRRRRTDSDGSRTRLLAGLFFGLVLLLLPTVAEAQDRYQTELVEKGDYYFRRGYYVRASEQYHIAMLENPDSGLLKLLHGQAMFAIGNFSYSAYNLRRGIRFMDYPDDLEVDLMAYFPSPNAFRRAVAELERTVEYYPNDPVGLSVLGYVHFFSDRLDDAERIFRRLLRVKENDDYASYFLRRIEKEASRLEEVEKEEPEEPEPKETKKEPESEPETKKSDEKVEVKEGMTGEPVQAAGEQPVKAVLAD